MRWLRPIVSLILLGVLLQVADFGKVVVQLQLIPPRYLGAALVLFATSILLFVYKWQLCLPAARYVVLLRSYLSSLFFFLLPTGTLGAEVSKLTIARSQGIPLASVAASITLDKLTGLAALAFLGALAGLLADQSMARAAAASLLLAGVAIVGAISAVRFWRKLERPLAKLGSHGRRIASLMEAVATLAENRQLVWRNLAAGILSQGAMVGVYICLAAGLGIVLPLPAFTLCVVAANLAAVLPISMAGLGVRELGLVTLLGAFGIQAEAATALAVSVFAVFLTGSLAGFVIELIPATDARQSR